MKTPESLPKEAACPASAVCKPYVAVISTGAVRKLALRTFCVLFCLPEGKMVMMGLKKLWTFCVLFCLLNAGTFAHVLGREGIAPKLPAEIPGIDRPFTKSGEKFTFAVVGDKTGGGLENWPIFDRAMDEISRLHPDFAIMVGDLIQGYVTDEKVMDEQWKEFVEHASRIRIPFFFLPGNHDIANKTMYEYWSKNVGKTYYSFDYKGCHFILLNTEEGWRKDEVQFGAEQMEWLKSDIAANRSAKHLFLFMHKPVWYHSGDALAQWEQVESWLQGLPYTVFAGHFHNLTYEVRQDRPYYVLSATGAGLDPSEVLELGAFHHYTAVTVDEKDVHLALIEPGSIHPHDIAPREFKDRAEKVMAWGGDWLPITQPPHVEYGMTLKNTLHQPLKVNVRFVAPEKSAWSCTPSEGSLTVLPGGLESTSSLHFILRYDFNAVFPLPSFAYEVFLGDKPMWKGSHRIAGPDFIDIKNWMVSGPFPLGVDKTPSDGPKLDTAPVAFNELSGLEKTPDFSDIVALGDGKYAAGAEKREWREAWVEEGGWVNFDAIYGGDYRIAYALCFVSSPEDKTVYAAFRADDLAKVLVNGEQIDAAGYSSEPHYFRLPLKKGWNTILVKTADYTQGWGFSLRIANVLAGGLQFVHWPPPSP